MNIYPQFSIRKVLIVITAFFCLITQSYAYSLDYPTSEKNLNTAYNKARKLLPKQEFQQLKKEQFSWLRERKKACGGAKNFSPRNKKEESCFIEENYNRAEVLFNQVKNPKVFESYVGNPSYTVKTLDINADGLDDKVIVGTSDYGNNRDLLVYINKNNEYNLHLKTENFTDEAYHQFSSLKAYANGFVITNAYPKRVNVAHHFFKYTPTSLILERTVYVVSTGNMDEFHLTICDIDQNVDMSSPQMDITLFPENFAKNEKCYINRDTYKVISNQAKIYSEPHEKSVTTKYFKLGKKLHLLDYQKDWIQFIDDKTRAKAWIKKTNLKNISKDVWNPDNFKKKNKN